SHPLAVEARPAALRLAGRHELEAPVLVEDPGRRVDPPDAQRLLDELRLGERLPPARRPPADAPDAALAVVVRLEPGPPGGDVGRVVQRVPVLAGGRVRRGGRRDAGHPRMLPDGTRARSPSRPHRGRATWPRWRSDGEDEGEA